MTENNVFALDTHHVAFVEKWASIFDTLNKWGLWRDQVVYSYSMVDMQDKVEHIDKEKQMVCPPCNIKIAAPRGDQLGARLLAQVSCMFIASTDSRVEYIHMDSVCAADEVCIQSTIGFDLGVNDHDPKMDRFFNFSYGYRNVRSSPSLKLIFSRERLGYSGRSKAQWKQMALDRRPDSTNAFDRTRCPKDPNAVVMAMDGVGCSGEMKAILSSDPPPTKAIASFRARLRARFHPKIVAPQGTTFDPTCINVVVHIRKGDIPKWRTLPLQSFTTLMMRLERIFKGIETDPAYEGIRKIKRSKVCVSRTYWIHTDAPVSQMETDIRRGLGWDEAPVLNIVGKSFSVLDAMAYMWEADVLIPSFSSISVTMGIAKSHGVVLYANDFSVDEATRTKRCRRGFCSTLYYPVANDPLSKWPNGLGNWIGIATNSQTNHEAITHTNTWNESFCIPSRTLQIPNAQCPIPKGKRSSGKDWDRTGQGIGARATWDRSTGRIVAPGDAWNLCSIVSGLMYQGLLPPTSAEIQRRRMVLIDVGAAMGGELLVGHRLGFHVMSFEARPSEYEMLHSDWGTLERTQIFHAAVDNVAGGVGSIRLFNAQDSSSIHASAVASGAEKYKMDAEKRAGRQTEIEVPSMSIDYAVSHNVDSGQQVAMIKVDTQGHELEVLQSGIRTIEAHHPFIVFEYDTRFRGTNSKDVLCFVQSLGYNCRIYQTTDVFCQPVDATDHQTQITSEKSCKNQLSEYRLPEDYAETLLMESKAYTSSSKYRNKIKEADAQWADRTIRHTGRFGAIHKFIRGLLQQNTKADVLEMGFGAGTNMIVAHGWARKRVGY